MRYFSRHKIFLSDKYLCTDRYACRYQEVASATHGDLVNTPSTDIMLQKGP